MLVHKATHLMCMNKVMTGSLKRTNFYTNKKSQQMSKEKANSIKVFLLKTDLLLSLSK